MSRNPMSYSFGDSGERKLKIYIFHRVTIPYSAILQGIGRYPRPGHPAERLKQRDNGAPAWGGAWTPPTAGDPTALSEADAVAAPAGANLEPISRSRGTAASRRQPTPAWAPSRRHTAYAESDPSLLPQNRQRQASAARTEPAPGGSQSQSPGAVPVREHPAVVPEKRPVLAQVNRAFQAGASGREAEAEVISVFPRANGAWTPPTAGDHTALSEADAGVAPA